MRALVLHEAGGPFRLEDVPIPKVGPREALVKVKACGIGLTLRWLREGGMGTTFPRIIGHEIAGTVAEVGGGVTNVKVGARVCVTFYLTCGNCEFCRKNRETLCRNFRGYVGSVIDGGFAEYVKLPAENLIPIPDEVSFEVASIVPDAIGTALHAIRERAQVRPADTVMVVGAGGGVGIHTVQMARLCGGWVIAVDTSSEKLEKAREVGADAVINALEQDVVKEAKRLTGGRGVDAVIDFVCNSDILSKDFLSLNRGGRLVTLAAGRPPGSLTVSPRTLLIDEVMVTGSRCCTKQEVVETLEIVKNGRIKPIITQRFSLEEVEKAFELIAAGKTIGRVVLVI